MKRYRVQFFGYNSRDLRKHDVLANEICATFKSKKSAKEYGEKMLVELYGRSCSNYVVRVSDY